MSKYFSAKSDGIVTNATGLFCQGCLTDKLSPEASPDPRYCRGCYDFLLEEADILKKGGSWRHPAWLPKSKKKAEKLMQGSRDIPLNMSIVNDKKISMDIIQPTTATEALFQQSQKRGRKPQELPTDLIIQLANDMGSVAIASLLKREHGITISYKTIQRILSGERK